MICSPIRMLPHSKIEGRCESSRSTHHCVHQAVTREADREDSVARPRRQTLLTRILQGLCKCPSLHPKKQPFSRKNRALGKQKKSPKGRFAPRKSAAGPAKSVPPTSIGTRKRGPSRPHQPTPGTSAPLRTVTSAPPLVHRPVLILGYDRLPVRRQVSISTDLKSVVQLSPNPKIESGQRTSALFHLKIRVP